MANYISSNANRFYVGLETAYGQAAGITAANRFPAVQLSAHQVLEQTKRRDKTGSRTFIGSPKMARRNTAYEVRNLFDIVDRIGSAVRRTFISGSAWWGARGQYGALHPAGAPVYNTANNCPSWAYLWFSSFLQWRIRFAVAFPDVSTMTLNAAFSVTPIAGTVLAPAVTYSLANLLPSVTLYDYWDPITAVQRVITELGLTAWILP